MATTLDAIDYLQKTGADLPCIYSHSGPVEICGYPYRNVTNEEIKAVASTGGFIALPFFSIMTTADGYPPIPMEHVIKIIDHIVNLVGIDHVALGSDDCDDNLILERWGAAADLYPDESWVYDRCKHATETGNHIDVYEPAKTWPAIYDAMKANAYSDEDCAKLFGGNSMRVYKHCEAYRYRYDNTPSELNPF